MGRNSKNKSACYTIKSLNLPTNFEKTDYCKFKYIKKIDYNNVKEYVVRNKHLGFIDSYKLASYLKNTHLAYRRLPVSALKGLAGRAIAKMSFLQSLDDIPLPSNGDNQSNENQTNIVGAIDNIHDSGDNIGEDSQSSVRQALALQVSVEVDPASTTNVPVENVDGTGIIRNQDPNNARLDSGNDPERRIKRARCTAVNEHTSHIIPIDVFDLVQNESGSEDDNENRSKKMKTDNASVGDNEGDNGDNLPACSTSVSAIKTEDGEPSSISADEAVVSQINNGSKNKKDIMECRNALIPKKISFQDIASYKDVLNEISQLVMHFRYPNAIAAISSQTTTGFLLYGPPGCGKSFIVTALAGELKVPLIKVAAPELISGVSGDSEKQIRSTFGKALKYRPSILFIDEIDAISKDRGSSENSMEDRVVTQLLCCMDELNACEERKPLIVIGATNQIHKIDPALRRAGRFDNEIVVGVPDYEARYTILKFLSQKEKLNLSPDISLHEVARLTPGYVTADIKSLILRATISAFQRYISRKEGLEKVIKLESSRSSSRLVTEFRNDMVIARSDFMDVMKLVQPSSKREGFITVPDTTWDDIGSLADIRKELRIAFLNPIKVQKLYNDLGLPISGGVLLYGPPGCGKTLVAKAVANEAGINFIAVNGPELLNMYVGGSEMAVRTCFQRARASQPCVIFFDEIDAICAKRDGGNAHANRLVNQLLTEMDGIRSRTGVFLMAATNRYDILDPAILRPGRFDQSFHVGLPKGDDRYGILQALTKDGSKPRLAGDVNLAMIAYDKRCDNCTGADLSSIVRCAGALAIEERMLQSPNADFDQQPPIVVSNKHFESALEKLRLRKYSSNKEVRLFEDLS